MTLADVHEGDSLPELSYDVTATTVVLGALASRDTAADAPRSRLRGQPQRRRRHLLEHAEPGGVVRALLTDWSGPKGRLGRMKFRMKGSRLPGDTMVLAATVEQVETDDDRMRLGDRCSSRLTVDGDLKTDCTARIACRPATTTIPGPAAATSGARIRENDEEYDLMDLDLTPEQEMLREMVRGVCSSYAPLETVRALRTIRSAIPPSCGSRWRELDLIGLMIPAEYGGSEMSALEGAVVYMELGRALAPSPHFVSAVMGAGVLLRAGSDEQKAEWLPRIVAGDAILVDGVARAAATASAARRAGPRDAPTATSSCSTA